MTEFKKGTIYGIYKTIINFGGVFSIDDAEGIIAQLLKECDIAYDDFIYCGFYDDGFCEDLELILKEVE